MKLVFLLVFGVFQSTYAQIELTHSITDKPALSLRCKDLHSERSAKIKIQQKLNALLQRNKQLIKKSPKARETLHATLKSNSVRIENELYLTNLQIEKMEENIIRSGCPGIAL
ncbi:MAG TPA: hypothetical protein VKY27_05450 [Bacteriovoracaceae bacterium]|nr:hypothetical protein [Bacteriovoracaceae bacterium]